MKKATPFWISVTTILHHKNGKRVKIVVVNTGVGNIRAIPNMLKRSGASAEISADPDVVRTAECLIFPGVGSFDAGIRRLREAELTEVLTHKALVDHTPILGICLGMQIMASSSEEGKEPGFGWVPGHFKRFCPEDGGAKPIRVPHMGWNLVHQIAAEPLYKGMEKEARFYFNHSYYFIPKDETFSCGIAEHGILFAAGLKRENIFGVQFHAEKSHRFGMKLLENFLTLASNA